MLITQQILAGEAYAGAHTEAYEPLCDQIYIGLEFEPQFTLLRFPKMAVYFESMREGGSGIEISRIDKSRQRVFVHVSQRAIDTFNRLHAVDGERAMKRLGIDSWVFNLEVRTWPVLLHDLPTEMALSNRTLIEFATQLQASITGGVGVFLPATHTGFFCTKHVNLSTHSHWRTIAYRIYPDLNHTSWSYDLTPRLSLTDVRLHLSVPYQFEDYARLIAAVGQTITLSHREDAPLLLGYIRGRRYIQCQTLR